MHGANQATFLSMNTAERVVTRDDELVSAAQAGSAGAFTELYSVYSRRLYKTILTITKNPEDAEDALQDTFLRAHLALRAFEGRSNIYSWLTRIAINSALMLLRRRRARPEILFDAQPDAQTETPYFEVKDSAPDPEQVYHLRQLRMRMLRAIRNLDSRLRTPLQLQMAKGSSIREIGQELNISEAAVKTRLHRARRRLSTVRDLNRPKGKRAAGIPLET
jgi:RNA polymerase sigma-70 factor, ECF subfamily